MKTSIFTGIRWALALAVWIILAAIFGPFDEPLLSTDFPCHSGCEASDAR